MKNLVLMLCVLVLPLVAATAAAEMPDVAEYGSCEYCGMYRDKFAHSRMLITYDDSSSVATCSIHCAAVDLANNIDKTPVSIQVGDFNSKVLLDAEQAFWVLGGDVPGVMTGRAKWAFADRSAAETFIRRHGGQMVSFEEAMAAAYEDMYRDTRMIREKRKTKRMQMQQGKS